VFLERMSNEGDIRFGRQQLVRSDACKRAAIHFMVVNKNQRRPVSLAG